MTFKQLSVALATVALITLTPAGDAYSLGPGVGTGTTGLCPMTAKITFAPKLREGTLSVVDTKISGKLGTKTSPCSGGTDSGVTLVGGSLKGAIKGSAAATCSTWEKDGFGPFQLTVKWKVAKRTRQLFPTTIDVAATLPDEFNLSGPGGSVQMTFHGQGEATNAKGEPQSFSEAPFTIVATTDQTFVEFVNACRPPSKGAKGFTLTGVNGASTLSS